MFLYLVSESPKQDKTEKAYVSMTLCGSSAF